MKVIAFDVNEVRDYCLQDDTDKSVTFSLGILDSYQWNYIRTLLAKKDFSLAAIELVRMGLKGWRGLKDKHGAFVPFVTSPPDNLYVGKREVLSAGSLDAVRPFIDELSVEIVKLNQLSEQDQKNSDTPLTDGIIPNC